MTFALLTYLRIGETGKNILQCFRGLEEETARTCSAGRYRSVGRRLGTHLTVVGVVGSSHYRSFLRCEELQMKLGI